VGIKLDARFYFNDVFVGGITDLIVQFAEKGFVSYGPKAIVQFFGSKEVVEQWYIVQTLGDDDNNDFNKVLLVTDNCSYKISVLAKFPKVIPVMVMPVVNSGNWKFKIRVFEGDGKVVCEENRK